MDQRIQERRDSKERGSQKHHTPATQNVRKGPCREFDKDACDRGGGENQTDQLRRRAEILGKARQDRAPRHLVAEAREQAGYDQS